MNLVDSLAVFTMYWSVSLIRSRPRYSPHLSLELLLTNRLLPLISNSSTFPLQSYDLHDDVPLTLPLDSRNLSNSTVIIYSYSLYSLLRSCTK